MHSSSKVSQYQSPAVPGYYGTSRTTVHWRKEHNAALQYKQNLTIAPAPPAPTVVTPGSS